ncbi:MAG: UbiA family prenyltransferase [Planctomycetes bacterium]|nr:UbiA family prenyltransferase [Planctomycetota bacterium]
MARRFDVVACLKLFRFPLVFTAIADSVTGYLVSFSGKEFRFDAWMTLGLLAIASGGLYAFGMALNDIADRKRDQEVAPNRVLPSGRLSLRAALIASFGVLAASAAALYFADYGHGSRPQRFVFWGLVVAGIVTYDCLIKLPPVMGLVRASNFLLGVAAGGAIAIGALPDWHLGGPRYFQVWHLVLLGIPEFVYVTALTYVSTLEEGNLDRRRLWIGASLMMAAALMMASWIPLAGAAWRSLKYGDPGLEVGLVKLPWLALFIATFLIHWIFKRTWQARDRKGILLLVRDGIGGIILLNATLLMSLWMVKEGLAVAALLVHAALSVMIFKKLA